MFTIAPAGVMLDTEDQVLQWVDRIIARAVISHDRPFMNRTLMTEQERAVLGQWLRQR